jgi:hypothetical protein
MPKKETLRRYDMNYANMFMGTEYPLSFSFYTWARKTDTLCHGMKVGIDTFNEGNNLYWELDSDGNGMVISGSTRHERYE